MFTIINFLVLLWKLTDNDILETKITHEKGKKKGKKNRKY